MTSPQAGGITPAYGFRYIVQGQPARHTRLYLEQSMLKLEEVLLARGVPVPGAADLAALAARVATLETKVFPRIDVYLAGATSFGGAFAVPFDTVRTAQTSPVLASNTNAYFTFDPSGRRVQIKQAGLYQVEVGITTTDAATVGQYIRACRMPTAATAGPVLETVQMAAGYGKLTTSERFAAGEYVGVFVNTPGSVAGEDTSLARRAHLTITRLSA